MENIPSEETPTRNILNRTDKATSVLLNVVRWPAKQRTCQAKGMSIWVAFIFLLQILSLSKGASRQKVENKLR
jgi:hypothetical protein